MKNSKWALVLAVLFTIPVFVGCGDEEYSTTGKKDYMFFEKDEGFSLDDWNETEYGSGEANYGYVCYLETAEGVYEKDRSYIEDGLKAQAGSLVSIEEIEIPGYVLNTSHSNNLLKDYVRADGTTTLRAYYDLATYGITVNGGTASTDNGIWGDMVAITPTYVGNNFEYEVLGQNAYMDGNTLIMGTEDVVVNINYYGAINIDNAQYVKCDSEMVASYDVASGETKGITFLYNTKATSKDTSVDENYFVFGIDDSGETAKAFLKFVGEEETVVKTAALNTFEEKAYEFKVKVNASTGIQCSLDGNTVISVSISDLSTKGITLQTSGRCGIYAPDDCFTLAYPTVTQGAMTKAELQTLVKDVMSTVDVEYSFFNPATYTVDKKTVSNLNEFSGFAQELTNLENRMNGLNMQDVVLLFAQEGFNFRMQYAKSRVKDSFVNLADVMTQYLLNPFIGGTQTVTNPDGIMISAKSNYKDTRWYIPNAYMLRSGLIGASNKGILDYAEDEVAEATSFEELKVASNKYIIDIVKATCMKNIDFYYWYKYNQLGGEPQVYNCWWFLYSYVGDSNYAYEGNVSNYVWGGNYRLVNDWFNVNAVDNSGASTYRNTTAGVIDSYSWIRDHLTVVETA